MLLVRPFPTTINGEDDERVRQKWELVDLVKLLATFDSIDDDKYLQRHSRWCYLGA